MMNIPRKPTSEECTAGARLEDFQGMAAFACWYPQMGGYVGKAVVAFYPDHVAVEEDDLGCFEAFIWHDGEFPIHSDDGRDPVCLHHCAAGQFIEFGRFVEKAQRSLMKPVEGA